MRWNLIRAGILRHPVTIETQTEAKDSYGAVTPSWSTFATTRAAIEPLVGKDYFAAQQTTSPATCRIRIRYLSGVTPAMRVVFGSRYFIIENVINVNEENREMTLMARETVA